MYHVCIQHISWYLGDATEATPEGVYGVLRLHGSLDIAHKHLHARPKARERAVHHPGDRARVHVHVQVPHAAADVLHDASVAVQEHGQKGIVPKQEVRLD
jgi:hypothetical protein